MIRLASAVALLITACGGAAEGLVGSWEFDPATFDLVASIRAWPKAELEQRIRETRFDVTFTRERVKWEQSMGYGWGSLSAEAAYTVTAVDGKRVTIETALTGVEKEKLVFSVEGSRLRFGLKGRSIILRRR